LLIDCIEINSSTASGWQSLLTHVPQHIFLADSSIAENIAFGVPIEDIDYERVKAVGHQAQLSGFVESLPHRYHTCVGERGAKLSGGQRQRIGIARALYLKADVLILDEATSALDDKTEKMVLNAINSLRPDLTVLMITHRTKTLDNCDRVYELSAGGGCIEKTQF
jgi:ATP-binding cassette subfamily B protein